MPSFVQEYHGRSLFSMDLERPIPKDLFDPLEQFIRNERNAKFTSLERRAELDLAEGLLWLHKNDPKQALRYFLRIEDKTPLYPAALVFSAKARIQVATDEQDRSAARALHWAEQALESLGKLVEFPHGELESRAKDLRLQSLALKFSALHALKQYDRAKIVALELLQFDSSLSEENRKEYYFKLFEILLQEEDQTSMESLFDELTQKYPSDPRLFELEKHLSNKQSTPVRAIESKSMSIVRASTAPDQRLFRQAVEKLEKGNPLDATSDLVTLFEKHPGTGLERMAISKLVDISRILYRTRQRWSQNKFIDMCIRLPPKPLYEIAKKVWDENADGDAEKLFKKMVATFPEHEDAGHALYFLGRIYENRLQWANALPFFERVTRQYSGSEFFTRARFKVGFMNYLAGRHIEAIAAFDFDFQESQGSWEKAQALYWSAQALRKLNREKEAQAKISRIQTEFSLTYYAFLTGSIPTMHSQSVEKVRTKRFWNREHENLALSYLSAGLSALATKILDRIQPDDDPSFALSLARLYTIAGDDLPSMQLAQTWIEKQSKKDLPIEVVNFLFPKRYPEIIESSGKRFRVNPFLLYALIKQESAFRYGAESRAGALGLMQLMPETARRVARELETPEPSYEDLRIPERNVELGTHYILKQLEKYNGQLIYALAAYNAGPHNADSWIGRWKNLPAPVFIELIPFHETRGYVKSILRNIAYYTFLSENRKVDIDAIIKGSVTPLPQTTGK